jgi:hypothetical protein
MDFAEFLKKAGVFAKDTAIQAGEEFVHNKCIAAKAEQRENDIIIAVVTLCDAGIKEAALYELLSKHWGIDSRTEAAAYINKGRAIQWPLLRLKAFLERQGIAKADWVSYKNKYQVIKKLETNPALCELSDEKLKAAIEK